MILWRGFLAALAAGAAAGVGALPLLWLKQVPFWLQDGLLGFAGGMMIGAASLSLIPPAVTKGGLGQVLPGLGAGAGLLALLDVLLPHRHARARRKNAAQGPQHPLLVLAAIVLHNLPEGLTMGVGLASGADQVGLILTLAIGIQNAPEGLLAALPLREQGASGLKAVGLALATGMAEPVAALVGMLLVETLHSILGFFLAFAAGAMFYVVADTLIPDSHGHGFERLSTFGFLTGFALMLVIRQVLA
ncbi:MAG TPA: ZIP family metal transporter [Firmicutes bacterium]|nr:ZIP family metal transporter [Bacillota bacterium]